MKLTFVHLSPFVAAWSRLGLDDDDLAALENQLMTNPAVGNFMRGTGGMRKVRFAPPSWHMGKSGAARVAYAHFSVGDIIYLVTIFGKNQKANLTKAEQNAAADLMKELRALRE